MRHRAPHPQPHTGRRWLAILSVGLLLTSAVGLGAAVHRRYAGPQPVPSPSPLRASAEPLSNPPGLMHRRRGDPRRLRDHAGGRQAQPRRWLRVLAALDRRRARAYATLDAGPLRRVYVPRSQALRADLRLLGRYRAKRVRVVRLRMRILDLRVRRRARGVVELLVHERVAGGTVRRRGRRDALPADDLDRRALTLRRGPRRGWRIGDVAAA